MKIRFKPLFVLAVLLIVCCETVFPTTNFAFSVASPTTIISVRVYLNPNTGRFWTMDSYAGSNEDPLSLHKYVYGADNPVTMVDPSGSDFEALDVGSALATFDAFSFSAIPGSILRDNRPETIYIRSFAPWPNFGYIPFHGTFLGDNRSFTTAHVPGGVRQSASGATSRITGIIKFLPYPLSIISKTAYSDISIDSSGETGTATPNITVTAGLNVMHVNMAGANPLVHGSPDINVHLDMSVQAGPGQTDYTGSLNGDAFPDAEVFVVDPSDNATMLHTFTTSGGRYTGPIHLLPGDFHRPMGTFSKWVNN